MSELEFVPDGYQPYLRRSAVTDPWLPLFSKTEGGIVQLALRVRPAHCNGKGFLHGGVINAMADNAMGLSVIETLSRRGVARGRGGSTISLAVDFLSSAQVGEWVEFLPRILEVEHGVGFADCRVVAGSRDVARGHATYRFFAGAEPVRETVE